MRKFHHGFQRLMQSLALLIAGAGLTSTALASGPANSSANQSGGTATSSQQLSAEQLDALRAEMKAYFGDESQALEVTEDQSGQQHIDLKGRNSNVILVRQNPDGSFSQTCVNQAETAVQFLANDQKPAAEDR